jgi:hypothetical protein
MGHEGDKEKSLGKAFDRRMAIRNRALVMLFMKAFRYFS